MIGKVLRRSNYYIQPPSVTLKNYSYGYGKQRETYTQYNYLRPCFSTYLKTRRFEASLELTKDYFYKCNVIDFGCGDGPFLPSLSKYFNHVVGIDQDPDFIKIASKLCDKLTLLNVDLVCNKDLDTKAIRSKIADKKYRIIYLLGVLEHVGDKNKMYESKLSLLKETFKLIDTDGIAVILVPKMVGISYLIQRLGLKLLGMHQEPISMTNLIKASIFCDTTDLEKKWDGGHLGFNHKELERRLKNEFSILKRKDLPFQVIYVVGRATSSQVK